MSRTSAVELAGLFICVRSQTVVTDDLPGEIQGKLKGASHTGRKGKSGMDMMSSDEGARQAALRGSLLAS